MLSTSRRLDDTPDDLLPTDAPPPTDDDDFTDDYTKGNVESTRVTLRTGLLR